MRGGHIDWKLLDAVWTIAEHARRDAEELFESCSLVQLRLLRLLAEGEPNPSLTGVARALACSKANVTQLVGGLARNGLLLKANEFSDGRARILQLTPHGRTVYEVSAGDVLDVAHRHFEKLSDDEKERLVELLGKVNATSKR